MFWYHIPHSFFGVSSVGSTRNPPLILILRDVDLIWKLIDEPETLWAAFNQPRTGGFVSPNPDPALTEHRVSESEPDGHIAYFNHHSPWMMTFFGSEGHHRCLVIAARFSNRLARLGAVRAHTRHVLRPGRSNRWFERGAQSVFTAFTCRWWSACPFLLIHPYGAPKLLMDCVGRLHRRWSHLMCSSKRAGVTAPNLFPAGCEALWVGFACGKQTSNMPGWTNHAAAIQA